MSGRPDISIVTRVVAAGVEFRGNEWKVLASISLLPAPTDDAAAAGCCPLSNFPERVEELVQEGIILRFDTIDMVSPSPLTPRVSQATSIAMQRQFVRRPDAVAMSNQLWNRRIFEIDDWGILTEALKRSQEMGSLEDLKRAPKDADVKKAADPKTIPYPDVFSLPRSDAALLYGFERARDVLRVVADQRSSCQIGACRVNTGGRTVDPTRFTFLEKPWLGMNEPLIRLAQSTMSDVQRASTGLKGDERQNHYLAMERRTQETIYRRQLEDKAKAADKQAQARRGFVGTSDPKEKFVKLREQARVRATSLPPSACAEACSLGSDDRIAEKLTDKVKSVHSLGGLPDVDEFGDPIFDPCLRTEDAWEAAVRLTGERFHAIQSMPSLARLFNLIIDVECPLREFKRVLEQAGADSKRVADPGAVDHFAKDVSESIEPKLGQANYMFLAAGLGDDESDEKDFRVWTLAKWRTENEEDQKNAGANGRNFPGETGHFWPCAMEEVVARLDKDTRDAERTDAAHLRKLSGIFQYDGVVDLGATACNDEGVQNPRYDIASLDTVNAVESDMQMDRRIENLILTPGASQSVAVDLGVHTRRSGGLVLLDRWRQDHVTSQITTAATKSSGAVVLDAEALTSGYRLDVGIHMKGEPRRRWRSLMHRSISFCDPDHDESLPLHQKNWMEEAIDELYGIAHPPGQGRSKNNQSQKDIDALERRMRADGASVALASRLKKNNVASNEAAKTTVFAEEIMVAWNGDPLGVECIDFDPHAEEHLTANAVSKGNDDIGFSIPSALDLDFSYGLDYDSVYQPPRLRYGWPYHFGLRPVFIGGATLPIELAISRYEKGFKDGLAFPTCKPAVVGRKFLRHERIEAPSLTVSSAVAEAIAKTGSTGGGDFALLKTRVRSATEAEQKQSSKTVAKITPPSHAESADGPDTTFRIFTPPILPLHEVSLHAVLDGSATESVTVEYETKDGERHVRKVVRPRDGLRQIEFSDKRGGFPLAKAKDDRDSAKPRSAVFRFASSKSARPIPFYPDPMASSYVVMARRSGSEDYVGGCLELPVRSTQMKYPEVIPLAIEITKMATSRRTAIRTIEDLLQPGTYTKGPTFPVAGLGHDGHLAAKPVDGLALHRVVVALAPGEDFEFEVWCIPSERDLAGKFDIVEGVSILLARESATLSFAEGRLNAVCVDVLKRHFPQDIADFKDQLNADEELLKGDERLASSRIYCGPGGSALPTETAMNYVARMLARALRRRPIPAIAAVSRMRALHAVDKPIKKPAFVGDDVAPEGLRIVRLNEETLLKLSDQSAEPDPQIVELLEETADWSQLSEDGATGALIGGLVEVDMLNARRIELRAETVSPTSVAIDDPKRGRTQQDMARGLWPQPIDEKTVDLTGKGIPFFDERISDRLFGFKVARNGRVTLPKRQATLLVLNDLPDVCLVNRSSAVARYNLTREQLLVGAADKSRTAASKPNDTSVDSPVPVPVSPRDPADRPCRVEKLSPFSDSMARHLSITAVTASPFANMFDAQKDAQTQDEPPSGDDWRTSKPACIWLPATRRPDRLSTKSLLPSFVWSQPKQVAAQGTESVRPNPPVHAATIVRNCLIRIRIRRPWFTSGEGERLGVVLWPPFILTDGLSSKVAEQLQNDKVPRVGPLSGASAEYLPLDEEFSDAKLGAGGAFVTRWGADPIQRGATPTAWLMPPAAFSDYDSTNPNGPQLEECVLMPVPGQDNESAGNAAAHNTFKDAKPGENPAANATPSNDNDKIKDQANRLISKRPIEYMTVSLLTYEPRFDPEYEHWYIDIALESLNLPEPFVRLGLVRFQKNARRELQVSEPVAEWIKILPKRSACVWTEPVDGHPNRYRALVSVTSPAQYGESGRQSADVCLTGEPSEAAFMRVHVMRNEASESGAMLHSVVDPGGESALECTHIYPRFSDGGTVWAGFVEFDRDRPDSVSTVTYSVFIEEIATFLPATFRDEPVPREHKDKTIETGPRFAAWIDLKFEAVGPAGAPSVAKPKSKPKSKPKLKSKKQSPSFQPAHVTRRNADV